jgi:hypothetical protein
MSHVAVGLQETIKKDTRATRFLFFFYNVQISTKYPRACSPSTPRYIRAPPLSLLSPRTARICHTSPFLAILFYSSPVCSDSFGSSDKYLQREQTPNSAGCR